MLCYIPGHLQSAISERLVPESSVGVGQRQYYYSDPKGVGDGSGRGWLGVVDTRLV